MKIEVLSDREHALRRLTMYAGSTTNSEKSEFVINDDSVELQTVLYSPALVKIISEIIDNSVDEHNRNGRVTELHFDYDPISRRISISDDGGIPVSIHEETGLYLPEVIFGVLRSSSNYDDTVLTEVIGTNGLGAKLTNICSENFYVYTSCDGKFFEKTWYDSMASSIPAILGNTSSANTTKIQFTLQLDLFNTEADQTDWLKVIEFYLHTLSANHPKLKIFFQNKLIKYTGMEEFIRKIYGENISMYSNGIWNIGICRNSNELPVLSFVNGVFTKDNGTHIDFLINKLYTDIAERLTKLTKLQIKPSLLKSYLTLYCSVKIVKPSFDSQCKTRLITSSNDFAATFIFRDDIVKNLVKTDWFQLVIDDVKNHLESADLVKVKKLEKTSARDLRQITKFVDCSSKNYNERYLFLAEGDSAKGTLLSVRDPSKHAILPLKGRPINGYICSYKELLTNEEFNNIIKILNYNNGQNFSKIIIAADADEYGRAICGLIIATVYRHLPAYRDRLYKLQTPQYVCKTKNQTYEFFNQEDFLQFTQNHSVVDYQYYKGLGTWESRDFKKFLDDDKYLLKIESDDRDKEALDLAFAKDPASMLRRKEWLKLQK